MKVSKTSIPGVLYIDLEPRLDDRGIFSEAFVKSAWKQAGIDFEVCQMNLSKSDRPGTIRGMHWQAAPAAQGKIVYAVSGSVYDAVIDVRRDSPTFGKSLGYDLIPQMNALFIPKGFAHGYQALMEYSTLLYLVDAPYSPTHERGLRYDDPGVKIPWPMKAVNMAPRDLKWPSLKEVIHA